ncbi:MAG: DUF692 domain-containing protein [Alphaproteobacteria bacterium]
MKSSIPAVAGLGLKTAYINQILESMPNVGWFEVHIENLRMGTTLSGVEKIRHHYPLSFHGVGLSLGSDHVNREHLTFVKSLCVQLNPGLVSEHLAWNYIDGVYINDLLPLPYTEESLQVMANNIDLTQSILQRQILIENPSTYLQVRSSDYEEADFILELACRSGCYILLDVNNLYVSAINHGECAKKYIKRIAQSGLVKEIHLAGHGTMRMNGQQMLVDSHATTVAEEVWQLYAYALSFTQRLPTLIEWDNDLPSFEVLVNQAQRANLYMEKVCELIPIPATI